MSKKYATLFCGSRQGKTAVYQDEARSVAEFLAKNNIGLVYGGSAIGLMGFVADCMLEYGGEIVGVMPGFLIEKEHQHVGLTRFEKVASLWERKNRLVELADFIIVLPGGIGTLDELLTLWVQNDLAQVTKPIIILNIDGFYDPLIALIDRMEEQGFLSEKARQMLAIFSSLEKATAYLQKINKNKDSVDDSNKI